MTMPEFMSGMLDLVFFLFDKSENVIVIIPFAVMLFCFTMSLIRRLMGRC